MKRWWQLLACFIAMVAVSSPQNTWTLFTLPLAQGLNARLSDIQVAFTLFVLSQSWLVPLLGYAADRLGSRFVLAGGGLLISLSWVGSGLASSLPALYVWYSLGGVGVGAVYGACVGTVLKWFPDRRGLAAGLVVGAYGSGAAVTVVPIQRMIEGSGYSATFITGGIVQGIVVAALARFMVAPPPTWKPGRRYPAFTAGKWALQSAVSFTPRQMLRTSAFYVMYLVSTLVTFGGLVVTAQLKPVAAAYGLDRALVWVGITALALALIVNLILSGLARPFWGWLSDQIGRYSTMTMAFTLGGLAILALVEFVGRPVWFVLLSGMTVLAWGATFVLFSAAIGDVFGTAYATTNTGILYTSKGVASIFAGWGAAKLLEVTGSWVPVLWTAAFCNLLAAALALCCLKRLVSRITAAPGTEVPPRGPFRKIA
jgi:OFA family oxalate/formate antiporter-like MFS transporter